MGNQLTNQKDDYERWLKWQKETYTLDLAECEKGLSAKLDRVWADAYEETTAQIESVKNRLERENASKWEEDIWKVFEKVAEEHFQEISAMKEEVENCESDRMVVAKINHQLREETERQRETIYELQEEVSGLEGQIDILKK